jgi:hypothetical protein
MAFSQSSLNSHKDLATSGISEEEWMKDDSLVKTSDLTEEQKVRLDKIMQPPVSRFNSQIRKRLQTSPRQERSDFIIINEKPSNRRLPNLPSQLTSDRDLGDDFDG